MTLDLQKQADLALLVDMHTEFEAVDIHDTQLDHDLGNLVTLSLQIMELLITDWELATSDEHRYVLWEEISNLHTLLRSVPLFVGDCTAMTEHDFRVLEMAVRCEPLVIALCPEYAEWRTASI